MSPLILRPLWTATIAYLLAVGLGLALPAAGRAQERPAPDLRLGGLVPSSVRMTATTSWAKYELDLTNVSNTDRRVLVAVFFATRPDVQYCREFWVPARTRLLTWMLVGPAPAEGGNGRELEYLLYDRTDGQDRLVLPPGEERVRSRRVAYRKREPSTAIVLDTPKPEPLPEGQLPEPDSPSEEAIQFARVFRTTRELPAFLPVVGARLPPTPEGFDGIDHLVLASNRVQDDPAGLRALRQWLEQGGRVWVMLDRVDTDAIAPLLGDALDFQVIDRIGLTEIRIEPRMPGPANVEPVQKHDRPVTFTRVMLPAGEPVWYTINGWPMWFTRPVGAGKVVFSTLGPRGWYRKRERDDPPSPDATFRDLPVSGIPLARFADELQLPPDAEAFRLDAFREPLSDEIGYTIPGQGTVALIFAGAVLAAVMAALALRHSRRPELLGWLGPAAALAATVVLLGLGEWSRRAAPPTVALGQVVHGVAGTEEAAVQGLLALYRPDSGATPIAAERGGLINLDLAGLEGQMRRLVLTDSGAWHWENLALPAGVRTGTFRGTVPTGEAIAAVGRFGPDGIEGTLSVGSLRGVSDAILAAPGGGTLPVQLSSDGHFRAAAAEGEAPGRFLPGTLLTDRQQRRQTLYGHYVRRPPDRPVLLAWAEPIDLGFELASGARAAGDALVVAPLRLERTHPGERVTVPGALIPHRRVRDMALTPLARVYNQGADLPIRFQLPAEVLPLQVERARLLVHLDAPGRRLTISGGAEGAAATELYATEAVAGPIRLEAAEQPWLLPDEGGGLHVRLAVGKATAGGLASDTWTIEQLELEVIGRVSGQ